MTQSLPLQWIRTSDRRTYRALIGRDLWGQPTVHLCWGSLTHRGGGTAVHTFDTLSDAIDELQRVAARRAKRGYTPAPTITP